MLLYFFVEKLSQRFIVKLLNKLPKILSCKEAKSERDMEILRKVKDNGHREKENSMKLKQLQNKTEYDTKCNIQKGK